ncbi:Cell wall-associated hydrolase, NlpC family [Sanguibacter gelidistatuariae]|uniref:Cell wall-associated hydrolase, NlpC family n=1 Tax=Sanguibacter gelidistatuariae TaxID=1814289 RepID=A0A1G6XH13_9MICO|nr:Cell wall-associated hydrolase, NlpC family [Sanguibacter gelidistatuariae]
MDAELSVLGVKSHGLSAIDRVFSYPNPTANLAGVMERNLKTQVTPARHRAARRPITPLTALVLSTSENVAAVRRRTVIAAASSGLFVSLLGGAPASAAPVTDSAVNTADVDALTAQAREALDLAPAVTVAPDASWTVELTAVSVTPAPEPVPEPARASPATSRAAERTATPSGSSSTAISPTDASAEVSLPASASGSAIIEAASRYIGVPYVWGGSTPSGFDCSGFTSYVYAQVGIAIPRTSGEQRAAGTVVSRDQAQPGDLIFSPGHIGIYAGGNTMIDSSLPGTTIQFREIWQSNPTFVRMT